MSTTRLLVLLVLVSCDLWGTATSAAAQALGTFAFALQPYCNVVTLTVTQEGSTYRLAGWDDACGAATRLPARGTIAPNLDGTLHIAFTVTQTTGLAVETSVRNFAVGPYAGGWTDNAGNAGTFVLAGTRGGNGVRPGPSSANSVSTIAIVDGSVNAVDVNQTEIQLRIAGACPTGQAVRAVNQDGSLVCAATGVVPSGRSIVGEFSLDSVGSGGNAVVFYVPFGAAVPSPLVSADVSFAAAPFTDSDPACTGSVLAPTAPAGKVCIYPDTYQNIQTSAALAVRGLLSSRGFLIYAPFVSGAPAGARMFLTGTWAYTAP